MYFRIVKAKAWSVDDMQTNMEKSLYYANTDQSAEKLFTISVLTENKSGLLNGVAIIFTKRKLNIESINVSETEVPDVSRYTIVVHTTRERIEKIVKQIQKLIEVLGAFVYEDDQVHHQEIALYKMPLEVFTGGDNKIEQLVRANNARVLVIEKDYIVIEKTGHKHETQRLYRELQPYGLLEFTRSARISISKSKRKTQTFIKELEDSKANSINIYNTNNYQNGKN